MSVKHQRNPRLNSSVRDLRENISNLQPNNCYQYVNCVGNKIQFHKKLIVTYSLHLLCVSSKTNYQSFTSHSSQSPCEDIEYTFQIDGTNLYVIKSLVKHTFSLEKYVGEKSEYLCIEFPEQQRISINSCSIGNTKAGVKVAQISDGYRMKNCANAAIIKPVQLIQQNIKLRATKLNSRSANKTIQFNSQSVKKLNFNWNKQAPKDSREDSPTYSNNWKPKRQAETSSVQNSFCQIKGVPLKKSVQKYEPRKQRSKSKVDKDLSLRSIKSTNILQRSTQRQNNMIDSKSNKNLIGSIAKNEKGPKMKENTDVDISSESYYTAKKLQHSFEVQLEGKKTTQTGSKENLIHTNCSFGPKTNSKYAYTQYRNNHRQSEANILSSSSNLDPQKFRKNISQIKIAQISRTLLHPKTKN